MTDRERENLRRRELLRRLAGAVAIAPAIQALAACAEDPAVGPSAPPASAPTGAAGSSTTMNPATAQPPATATPPSSMPMAAPPKPAPVTPPPSTTIGGAAAPMTTGGAAAPMTGAMTPAAVDLSQLACVVTPAMTVGPFFFDGQLERSDLLEGETETSVTSGKVLELVLGVYTVSGNACAPLAGAKVDIWHADTKGVYSAVPDGNPIQPMADVSDKKFLRGWQTSGEDGIVRFKTIYPGFYGNRAIHIHFKIRVDNSEFVSQFFFDDTLNDKVLADAAYMKTGMRVTNRMDQVYTAMGPEMLRGCCPVTNPPPAGTKLVGDEMLLDAQPSGDGYTATFKIGWMMA